MGWERGNESMEGLAIQAYSAGLSPLVCRLFLPPLFVLELLITSLSPLRCIPHGFVILPRKRIREPSLSHHTFPLSHSAFLCLCPPVVRSAPCCLSTLHSDLPPHGLWCHMESKGSWKMTRGRTGLCPAHISGCRKLLILLFQESASLVWRKCLLFQEVFPGLFKEFQSGSPIFCFSSKLIWCVCTCQLSCHRACYVHQ